jgi:hypothetical protein
MTGWFDPIVLTALIVLAVVLAAIVVTEVVHYRGVKRRNGT